MPIKNPPHPGEPIKTEIIEALGLNLSKAAEILKVSRATLSDLLHCKTALTPDMTLRIEEAFGPDMVHLLPMQLAYDVMKTREHAWGISIKREFSQTGNESRVSWRERRTALAEKILRPYSSAGKIAGSRCAVPLGESGSERALQHAD